MRSSIGADGDLVPHAPAAGKDFRGRSTYQAPGPRPPCAYRESCGCQMPQCLHPEKGPEHGQLERQYKLDGSTPEIYRVSQAACVGCGGVEKP